MTLKGSSAILLVLNALLVTTPMLILKLEMLGVGPVTLNRALGAVLLWFGFLLLIKKEPK